MKFGQALSVFEAALPEELAAPYRDALTRAAGRRPADARGHASPGARRAVRAPAGATASRSSTTSRPPPRASARCIAPCGPTAARSPSRCSTPAPGPPLLSDLNQLARLARLFSRRHPVWTSSRSSPSCKRPRRRGARLPPRGRRAARVRRGVRRATPTSSCRGSASRAEGDGHRVGRRDAAVALIRSGDARGAQPRRPAARALPLLRARPGPGCCTPTRTPATSGSCADGRLVRPRLRRGRPAARRAAARRSAAACASRWPATPTRCSRACASRASCGPTIDLEPRSARSTTCCRCSTRSRATTFHFTRSLAAGEAARIADPRSPASTPAASSTSRRRTC